MSSSVARRGGLALCALLAATACSSAYYSAMERLGYEKRDILVDRVDDSRAAQAAAAEQFDSALEQFLAVTDYQGGDLEAVYRRLNGAYRDSAARAETVRRRIGAVEKVAGDLFAEWRTELDLYSDPQLRRASARQLDETRQRYAQLIDVMHQAEKRMDPVLRAFRDRVLYLKHNLNARAIAALREDRQALESDIRTLIEEMNRSIAEAEAFIAAMQA